MTAICKVGLFRNYIFLLRNDFQIQQLNNLNKLMLIQCRLFPRKKSYCQIQISGRIFVTIWSQNVYVGQKFEKLKK